MAMMFGRFEIQSELSRSETALIYKALDMQTNQAVALKTQSLEPLGSRADGFVNTLIAEGESTRDLVSQNIVVLYGAGEIDGKFCAAMEYIQGNSVATMVARNEGFSIWDLLDISRQVCAGLEYAAAKGVAHHSLEPAKIMVQWDGMVKILGYGISNMSLIEAESGNGLGRLMPYCSPEQIRGEAIDLRSNLFTLGTILYEMMVCRPAFDATDPVMLVNLIESHTPPSPSSVNPKIQPAVSALIMKALAKNPAERYQSARELLADLEECKDNGKKTAVEIRKPVPAPQAPKIAVDPAVRSAAASKFVGAVPIPAKPTSPRPIPPKAVSSVPAKVNAPVSSSSTVSLPTAPTAQSAARAKAVAAAAGAVAGAVAAPLANSRINSNSNLDSYADSKSASKSASKSESTSGARLISDFDVSAFDSQAAAAPVMSTAILEPEPETYSPRVAVDPMMAEPAAGSSPVSFSDLAEMPPLKEPVFEAPIPEPIESPDLPQRQVKQIYPRREQKPRIQPREVAEKAMQQIATIPPRLMLFSILGAVGLILVIAISVFLRVRSADDDSTAAPRPTKVARSAQPGASTPVTPRIQKTAPPVVPMMEARPRLTVRQIEKRVPTVRRAPAPAPVPVVVSGQALIDSTPRGAQFQVDGKSDPLWVTPFSVAGLSAGKHIVSASKSGYSAEIRSVDVVAGNQASLLLHLSAVNALVVVNSTPAGAEIVIDGRTTGRVTPAQFAMEKGSHTVLVRKQGYLDETVTTDLSPAQNFQYSPALRALGNAADMRTVGKFNKLFGHGGDSTAGMGAISVHTQPKGAQVAINQRILDRTSPVDVMLGPGNYVVDITLTGFKPVHKIVNVDKGGKAAIDEILERQ